jgi:phytoene dehydrogenase-like protein
MLEVDSALGDEAGDHVESASAEQYDAIVIGSGIGSLATAALLAKIRNMRVLVLEKHFKIGGQTHEFRRKGKYEFDIGIHYVGSMGRGLPRAIFDFLTEGKLGWERMPAEFEKFVYPDFEFSVPSNPDKYRQRLAERYPAERAAIDQYFKDVARAAFWFEFAHLTDTAPGWFRPAWRFIGRRLGGLASITTANYLSRRFHDPQLIALLASQWGDYGVTPDKSCFGMHAALVRHYWNGGWYPIGGAKQIANHIVPAITRAGGKVLSRKCVKKILTERGRVTGVLVVDPFKPSLPAQEYRADIVISGAGAANTYLDLLADAKEIPFRSELTNREGGLSATCVFLGLKSSPKTVGATGANFWIFNGYEHSAARLGAEGMCYVSFPSLKNPAARSHTVEILTFMSAADFSPWEKGTWKRRGKEYEQMKTEIAQRLISMVEQRLPGFANLVEYTDVATPLTMEFFQGNADGMFYGMPAVPARLYKKWTYAKSPIKGLYLTGSDVMCPGLVGALIGGIKCAGAIMGNFGFYRLMSMIIQHANRRRPRVLQLKK